MVALALTPESTPRRLFRVVALGGFALPDWWGFAVAAGVAAVAEFLWRANSPKTPHVVAAAIGGSIALTGLPAWMWVWTRPVESVASWLSGSVDVGWSLLLSPGSLALALACGYLRRTRAATGLVMHAGLTLLFLMGVGAVAVPQRLDEPTTLLAVLVYRTLIWVTAAGGLLWADAGQSSRPGLTAIAAGAALLGLAPGLLDGDSAREPQRVAFLWPESDSPAAPEFATAHRGYGFANAGLYGEWPRILERAGDSVERITRVDASTLRDQDLLIIVTGFRDWFIGEREEVTAWLRGGGRVVIVGEHSDQGGCQRRLNPLLEPFGISLEFTTTNGLLGDGLRGLVATPGRFARMVELVQLLPYNRGGSLALTGEARPLAIGRYWHADLGDPLAPDRAFLSDYRLSAGDRIGDITLMALHEGKGRLLVSGDSTPFLNQNALFASSFLLDLVGFMTRPVRTTFGVAVALLALAGALLVLVLERRESRWSPLLLLGLAACALIYEQRRITIPLRATQQFAVVSTSENNILDLDPFSARSPTALGLAFSRFDLTPMFGDWERLDRPPSILAVLNPSRPPEVQRLVSWAKGGTTVVLAGDGDNEYFRTAAAALGVLVTERPLGNLHGEQFTTYTSWEISHVPQGASSLSAEGFVVGAVVPVGSGRIVVFADGGFFLSKNLEMENTYDAKNVNFVRRLLVE